MERSDLYSLIWIVVLFVWMNVITPFIPEGYRNVVGILGLVVCVVGMVTLDQFLKWTAASWTYIELVCRPSNVKLHLFVKDLETVEVEPNVYATQLILAEKIKHPFYQTLQYIVLKHKFPWEERMQFRPGKAVYKGYVVDHPKTARAVAYEPFEGSFDVDHLNPKPIFWLKEAPGDYYIPETVLQAPLTVANGGGATAFEMERLIKENEDLKKQIAEEKRSKLDWHQKAVRLEEVVDQLKNELLAVLKSKADFKGAVIEYMLTIREAQLKIENALKQMRGFRFTLSKWVAILILGLAAIGVYMLYPEQVIAWLSQSQNQLFIIILAGVVVFAYYYARKVK